MNKIQPDSLRAHRWRSTMSLIRRSAAAERDRLLHQFGDEIRALAPLAVRASSREWDVGACLGISTALGVIIGAWMAAEPTNPEWPGRDRLFLARANDLMAAASALSIMGFFQPEHVARLVDAAAEGADIAIPGLEIPGLSTEAKIMAAWDSAVESAWSKRRWRQHFGPTAGQGWAIPQWRGAAEVWRSCIVIDHLDGAAAACRSLPGRSGESPAGMVAIVTAPRDASTGLAQEWRECGWESAVVGRFDASGLYSALTAPAAGKPFAIILAISQTSGIHFLSSSQRAAKQGLLIGELSDDQFNAIMDESLQF